MPNMHEASVTSSTKKKEEENGEKEEDSVLVPLNLSPLNCLRIHIAVCSPFTCSPLIPFL